MFLDPTSFSELEAIDVTIEERRDRDCCRQTFAAVEEIPERVQPCFGPPEMLRLNTLYLGNRIREVYESRDQHGVFHEPYVDPTPRTPAVSGTVHRTITIRIGYTATASRTPAAKEPKAVKCGAGEARRLPQEVFASMAQERIR